MTRRPDLCTSCGLPLGESRLIVHDASGRLTGQFHVKDCLADYELMVEADRTRARYGVPA
jgi:hypothetical protein